MLWTARQRQRMRGWLSAICLGLLIAATGLAQDAKLRRDWLTGEGIPIGGEFPAVFSPDGKMVASAGEKHKNIQLWDSAIGKNLATFQWPKGIVRSLAFSPDGKLLASGHGGEDDEPFRPGKINLWNVATGELLRTLEGHAKPVYAVAFSPDGKTLASRDLDGSVKLWDVASGKKTATLEESVETPQSGGDQTFVFSRDGKLLASGDDAGTVKLLDVVSGKGFSLPKAHRGVIHSLAFSPDSKYLACAHGEPLYDRREVPEIKLWDLGRRKNTLTIREKVHFRNMHFSPDSKTLIVQGYSFKEGKRWEELVPWERSEAMETLKAWDVATGKNTKILRRGADPFPPFWDRRSVSNRRLIAMPSLQGAFDILIVCCDPDRKPKVPAQKGHEGDIYTLTFSPDGKTLASGSQDRTVKLWDVISGRATATLQGHADFVTSVVFSPDGKRLASGSADGTIRLWETASGKTTAVLKEHAKAVTAVVYSPDGKILASGGLDGVKLWDVATAKLLATLPTRSNPVWSVAFNPDGKTLAVGEHENVVSLWDVARRQRTVTLEGHWDAVNAVAFSPDGTILATGSGVPFFFGPWPNAEKNQTGEIKLWRVADGKPLDAFREQDGPVHSLTFSPDGKMLLAAGKRWEVASGKIIDRYKGTEVLAPPTDPKQNESLRTSGLHPAAFSPAGNLLATVEKRSAILLRSTVIIDRRPIIWPYWK